MKSFQVIFKAIAKINEKNTNEKKHIFYKVSDYFSKFNSELLKILLQLLKLVLSGVLEDDTFSCQKALEQFFR